jgi:uncharacterized circularly permuted ATP-grasp superfamily protein
VIRYYLGEEPMLRNGDTYRLEDPDQLAYALEHLDELVVKPVAGSGGYGILIGPQASDEQLYAARQTIRLEPRAWTAQQVVTLSTAPTSVGDRLVPRHLDLRPFAINDGNEIWVLPGGLSRVALVEGSLVVNSSQGGGSKDTWVTVAHPEASMSAGMESSGALEAGPGEFTRSALANAGAAPALDPQWDQSERRQQQEQQQQQQQRHPWRPC